MTSDTVEISIYASIEEGDDDASSSFPPLVRSSDVVGGAENNFGAAEASSPSVDTPVADGNSSGAVSPGASVKASPEVRAEGPVSKESADNAEGEQAESLNPSELSQEDQQEVEELKERDREVRAHEHAHIAAAGPYSSGGIQFEYERGPDGRRYATGGEVGIDTSKVPDDPEATIRKAQVVRRAALAPSEPSPQDRRVAAEASQMESEARREISQRGIEGDEEGGTPDVRGAESDKAVEDAVEENEGAGASTSTSGGRRTFDGGSAGGDVGQILDLIA